MKKVLGLTKRILKVIFILTIFLWTMVMNFIGFMVCAISSQG